MTHTVAVNSEEKAVQIPEWLISLYTKVGIK